MLLEEKEKAAKAARLTLSEARNLSDDLRFSCDVQFGRTNLEQEERESESYLHKNLIWSAIHHAVALGMRFYLGGVGRKGIFAFADLLLELNGNLLFVEAIASDFVSLPRKRLLSSAQIGLVFVVSDDVCSAPITDFLDSDMVMISNASHWARGSLWAKNRDEYHKGCFPYKSSHPNEPIF